MWLNINKPVGLTSFNIVGRVRRKTGVKKVGHAGTLDPFASGVLVVAVGRECTRMIDTVQAMTKEYLVRFVLGIETDTLDPDGIITRVDDVTDNALVRRFLNDGAFRDAVFERWVGDVHQLPPRFSAKKINGVPMYHLARANVEFEVKPSRVTIYSIDMVSKRHGAFPTVDMKVSCGKGTYIRSLVRDIGSALGTVAYAQMLVRTRVGEFTLDESGSVDTLCG